MGSKPTPLPQFLPLEPFFMRLPSSSSLILASLAVSSSSSSSSLSALAAPAGDGLESLSSPAPVPPPPPTSPLPPQAPIPHGSDDKMAQPNSYLQDRSLVGDATEPLLPPGVAKAILGTLHGILDPVIGPSTSAAKARGQPLDDVVKHLVPGKTSRAEITDDSEDGVDSSSGDSSLQAGASTAPAAGSQDTPADDPSPPAGCSSQPSPRSGPVKRQAAEASNGESGANLDPNPPANSPSPPVPSGSGANVGASTGGDVGCSG